MVSWILRSLLIVDYKIVSMYGEHKTTVTVNTTKYFSIVAHLLNEKSTFGPMDMPVESLRESCINPRSFTRRIKGGRRIAIRRKVSCHFLASMPRRLHDNSSHWQA